MSPLRVLHSLFELAVSPVHSNLVVPTHIKLPWFNIHLEELELHLTGAPNLHSVLAVEKEMKPYI